MEKKFLSFVAGLSETTLVAIKFLLVIVAFLCAAALQTLEATSY